MSGKMTKEHTNNTQVVSASEMAIALIKARAALEIINRYNHINNDLQAYLFDVAEWGMGKISVEPLPETFGIE